MADTLYTIEEAAVQLKISRSTLHQIISKRRIGFYKLGRRIYFSQEDLDRYKASRRVEAEECIRQ